MTPLELINKYYDDKPGLKAILLSHSQDVAKKALSVADKHPELNLDKDFLYRGAMLHDIGIFFTSAPAILCEGTHPYILHGYLGAELMRKEGEEAVAKVCERHTGTGLTVEDIERREIPLPRDRTYIPQSMEEKVICYADKFFSKTKLGKEKSLEKVRKSMLAHGEDTLRRFDEMHALFG